MKRMRYNILYSFAFTIIVTSCGMPGNNSEPIQNLKKDPLTQFVQDWKYANPQWENNQAIKSETDEAFLKAFVDSMDCHNLFEETSFTLEEVRKYKSKYVVLLTHGTYFNHNIRCRVLGFVPKEYVANLVENKQYRFTGRFKSVVLDIGEYIPYKTALGDMKFGLDDGTIHLATSKFDIDSIWIYE